LTGRYRPDLVRYPAEKVRIGESGAHGFENHRLLTTTIEP
jgi:hypothetical protein